MGNPNDLPQAETGMLETNDKLTRLPILKAVSAFLTVQAVGLIGMACLLASAGTNPTLLHGLAFCVLYVSCIFLSVALHVWADGYAEGLPKTRNVPARSESGKLELGWSVTAAAVLLGCSMAGMLIGFGACVLASEDWTKEVIGAVVVVCQLLALLCLSWTTAVRLLWMGEYISIQSVLVSAAVQSRIIVTDEQKSR